MRLSQISRSVAVMLWSEVQKEGRGDLRPQLLPLLLGISCGGTVVASEGRLEDGLGLTRTLSE